VFPRRARVRSPLVNRLHAPKRELSVNSKSNVCLSNSNAPLSNVPLSNAFLNRVPPMIANASPMNRIVPPQLHAPQLSVLPKNLSNAVHVERLMQPILILKAPNKALTTKANRLNVIPRIKANVSPSNVPLQHAPQLHAPQLLSVIPRKPILILKAPNKAMTTKPNKVTQRKVVQRKAVQRKAVQRKAVQRKVVQRKIVQRKVVQRKIVQRKAVQRNPNPFSMISVTITTRRKAIQRMS